MLIKGKEADWPGVSVATTAIRDYPTGELTSEIIGFLGPSLLRVKKNFGQEGFYLAAIKLGMRV